MIRKTIYALLLCTGVAPLPAQDLAKAVKNIQIHGFATQGLLYSTHNNYLQSSSSSGDVRWTDAVVSFAVNPLSKLRVGVQLRYFKLGAIGGATPQVDWALADYKVNDFFGIRAGKVKTPIGLFNDSQDIDPVHLWTLLPQSAYSLDNRSFFLAHLGGEVYGNVPLGERRGKLSYRAYGGQNALTPNEGYQAQLTIKTGLQFLHPIAGPMYGADLRWQTPWQPLLLGSSILVQKMSGDATMGSIGLSVAMPAYYARFERGKFYAGGEYRRNTTYVAVQVGPFGGTGLRDQREWFAMTSYRVTPRLQVGAYYSHHVDATAPKFQQDSSSKDLVFSARYDFNANFYAKAENHLLHGTSTGFYPEQNPLGLVSRTDIVVAKLGFSF